MTKLTVASAQYRIIGRDHKFKWRLHISTNDSSVQRCIAVSGNFWDRERAKHDLMDFADRMRIRIIE